MAHSDFHLQFQDFQDEGGFMNSSDGTTTVSINDESLSKTPKQGGAAGAFDDDRDPLETDDKTELLGGEKKNSAFWTLEFYQTFFDVDTRQVVSRIIGSVLPWRGRNFVRHYIRNNPDLYGPFWICATLVFAIGVSGNLSSFLAHLYNSEKYVPNFRKVTVAATVIYSYAWLVPLALWGFLTWRNRKISNLVSYSFMEIVCVYGYSLFIYIPVVLMWAIPYEPLHWITIVVALCLSGSVLVLTFWPVVREDQLRVTASVLSVIILLHVLLALCCKTYFYSSYTPHTGNSTITKP